jgi:hypothetical protein
MRKSRHFLPPIRALQRAEFALWFAAHRRGRLARGADAYGYLNRQSQRERNTSMVEVWLMCPMYSSP